MFFFIYVKEKKQKFSVYWTQTEPPAEVEKKDTDIVFFPFHFRIQCFKLLQMPCRVLRGERPIYFYQSMLNADMGNLKIHKCKLDFTFLDSEKRRKHRTQAKIEVTFYKGRQQEEIRT